MYILIKLETFESSLYLLKYLINLRPFTFTELSQKQKKKEYKSTYVFQFEVDPHGIGFDLEIPLGIIIGTIPLRQVVQQYYPQAMPSAPAITAQPWAPPFAGQPVAPPLGAQPWAPPFAGQPGAPPLGAQPGAPPFAGQPGAPPVGYDMRKYLQSNCTGFVLFGIL